MFYSNLKILTQYKIKEYTHTHKETITEGLNVTSGQIKNTRIIEKEDNLKEDFI